jgi:N-methylhydantoinase B
MVDPITLAVVRGRLEQIVEEMDAAIVRAAFSTIVAEQADRASAIHHPQTGETIVQGNSGLPIFNTTMQFAVEAVLRKFGSVTFQPGDVFILNDPYMGGTHLPDVKLIKPAFYQGELLAILACTIHWQDIGAMVLGGFVANATDIHQEGIIIPPMKLFDRAQPNEGVLQLLFANVRNRSEVEGDFQASLNTLSIGEARLVRLTEDYGFQVILGSFKELLERSEKQTRSYIEEIPEGIYCFTDYLDNDGFVDEPLKIHLKLEIRGSSMFFDFSGSSPSCKGPVNMARYTTISACHLAVKHIFPDIPVNGGCFKTMHFNIPDETFLSARYPSPINYYPEPVGRVIDVVWGAMAQAIPDRIPAACFSTTTVTTITGRKPGSVSFYMGGFPYAGGYGGSKGSDGLVHGVTPLSMANFPPVEVIESTIPLLMKELRIRDNSAGAGFHRGGCGTKFSFEARASGMLLNSTGDRTDHFPFGLLGGLPAKGNVIVFHLSNEDYTFPMRSKGTIILNEGDIAEFNTPGGGGYGNPLDRPPELVLQDVIRGYVSPQTALEAYAVKVESKRSAAGRTVYCLDKEATETMRSERQKRLQRCPT